DARRLAELLRAGMLKPVYHGHRNSHRLKELSRSYLTLVHDGTRVMNRIKAIYRSQGIRCAGQRVYSLRYRVNWLEQASCIPLSTTRWTANFAEASASRSTGREPQSSGPPASSECSRPGINTRGSPARLDPDAASFSQQAPTLGLCRSRFGHPHQRRLSPGPR